MTLRLSPARKRTLDVTRLLDPITTLSSEGQRGLSLAGRQPLRLQNSVILVDEGHFFAFLRRYRTETLRRRLTCTRQALWLRPRM